MSLDTFMPKFVSNPNWRHVWFITIVLTAFWISIAMIVPAHVYRYVSIVLGAIQTVTLVIMRGGKYVLNRELEIPDGILVTPPTIPPAPPTLPRP